MGDAVSLPGQKDGSGSDSDSSNGNNHPPASDQQEAHVQPQHNQVTVVAQKKPLEVAEDDADDIDLPTVPPPMKIQDHIFKAASKEDSSEDLSKKVASTLTIQPDTENAVKDLEDMVNQRVGDPNHDNPFDHQLSSESGGETADDPVSELTEEKKEMYREKRSYVMQELLDTEKDYVKDLGLIVEGYMEYLKEHGMPEDLQGKDKIVFGNIHQIYDWHRENFSPEIEKAVWDVDQLGSLFTRYERRLHMYVKYCENKPKSEYIVAEYIEVFEDIRQKLGHRLMLPDLLIKPVQRIMKYQLLLRDIQKYTDRAGEDTKSLKKALAVMCVVPKAANDMMQVGRLQGFDGKITAQGKLLLQDTLLVSEISQGQSQPKFKERRVFLFEQIILFSEMSEKKRGDLSNANYVYKNSIKVNNMALTKQVEGEPLRFMLINKTPGSDCKFVIQAPSDAIKHTWTEQITSLLDMQGDFLRALQSPIEYQNKVRKETSTPELSHTPREGLLRKTQSQSHPKKDRSQTPPGSLQDSKYTRCRSVPYPGKANVEHDDSSKLSCPNSPTETDKEFDQEKLTKLTMTSSCNSPSFMGEVSPKPKKNIFEGFKTSLKKSKSDAPSTSKSETNKVPDLLHDDEIQISINNGGPADGATNHNTSSDNNEDESVSLTAS